MRRRDCLVSSSLDNCTAGDVDKGLVVADRERHFDVALQAGSKLDDQFLILHKSGELEPEAPADPINDGGAGVVYLAQNSSGMELAVKLLSPEKKFVVQEADFDRFKRTFAREIRVLSGVTHTRIAKIISSGTAHVDGHDIPYYAMEYIKGDRLDVFLAAHKDIGGLEFLTLFDQIFDGLEYLHRLRILHGDLKAENLLARAQLQQYDAKIVDLGVAKVLDRAEPPQDTSVTDVDTSTYFYSSARITRPEWKARLGQRISETQIEEMFPSHDLYSLGVVISETLQDDAMRARVADDLGESGIQALEEVSRRLLLLPTEGQYDSVTSLRQDWDKVHPRYLAPLGVAELAVDAQAKTSIATPGGRVGVSNRVLNAINHPLLQRLRNVPQLELVQLVYPGATHTRLLHSISTFDMARRYVSHLLRDTRFRLLVDPIEIQALLVMALCHDVGHYPLSHMFEDWSYLEAQAGEHVIPSDDDLFWAFLDPERSRGTPWEQYGEIILSKLPDNVGTLADCLTARGGFRPEVLDMVAQLDELKLPGHRILKGILDSPIDADKVAYLSDDSAMTGVRYGLGMDLDALLGSLRTPRANDMGDGARPIIAIEDKGLPAAEQVMLARYWMIRRVYWHHTNRSLMAMVKFVLAELRRANSLDLLRYFEATLLQGPNQALEYLSAELAAATSAGAFGDDPPVDPLEGIRNAGRTLYKRFASFASGDAGAPGEIFQRLRNRRGDALLDAAQGVRETLSVHLGVPVRRGEVLIDVPQKERARPDTTVLVYLRKAEDPVPIEESPVVAELVRQFDTHVRKARVYVSPRVLGLLGEKADLRGARAAVEELLREI
jgi:HD superfamily phosphohydrolase/tRNA A-37 threonylcarbamoyl transferase component Bud32